jgi:ubiquinone/menaquinone biosynthesis C-methylase UbiE
MSLAAMVLAEGSEGSIRHYDRWIELSTLGQAGRARRAILERLAPGERLLDIGCGTGTLAIAASRLGAGVIAVDRSPAMLGVARDRARAAGVTVDWRHGDAAFPPVDGETFDVACATFVLGEMSLDLASLALRRMAAAVRPGGLVVVADEQAPDRASVRAAVAIPRALLAVLSFTVLERLAPTRHHPWRALLEDAGLDVIAERRYGPFGLVVLVARRPAELTPGHRPIGPLEAALPTGPRGTLARAAAWLDLPIAVRSGVYAIGRPGRDSPVVATANFLASVDAVRRGLAGRDAYVVVEDTDGWNVWCAADAGLFTAEKVAALIDLCEVAELVETRRIVVPRLGGRIRRPLAALTGWDVDVGPIEARDLPDFLVGGLEPRMRDLRRLYRLRERVRVGALTLVQLPLILLPLLVLPRSFRRPVVRFGVLAAAALPLGHDMLPGRTGVVKGVALGSATATLAVVAGRLRPKAAMAILLVSPLLGWLYQSSTPVIHWKRFLH